MKSPNSKPKRENRAGEEELGLGDLPILWGEFRPYTAGHRSNRDIVQCYRAKARAMAKMVLNVRLLRILGAVEEIAQIKIGVAEL